MAFIIESLESRTLLSASPALTALETDGKALIATVVVARKVANSDSKLILADLKAAGETKTSRAPLKTLAIGDRKALATLGKDVHKAVALVRRDVLKGIAVIRRL